MGILDSRSLYGEIKQQTWRYQAKTLGSWLHHAVIKPGNTSDGFHGAKAGVPSSSHAGPSIGPI